VFRDDEFAPSTVTDRPDPNTNDNKSNESKEQDVSNVASDQDDPPSVDNLPESTVPNVEEPTLIDNSSLNEINSEQTWGRRETYAQTLNRKLIHVPGDGHCL